ncbi:MAG: AAA family ATPase [Chloroflexota bacterium]
MITRLTVSAFKGLRKFSIEPQRVNLLIGANGTGKTNFADLIAFIANLGPQGLASTIQSSGGLAQVRTRQPGAGTPYRLQLELQLDEDRSRGIRSAAYHFALAQAKEIKVQQEKLEAVVYKRRPGKPAKQGFPRFDYDQSIQLTYKREGSTITDWCEALGPPITEFDNDQELILAAYGRLGELRTLTDYLGSWRVYNIDAAIVKQSTGGSDLELERFGANLVPFVAKMLHDDKIRAQLMNDLQEAVPYIQKIEPDRVLTYQTLRFLEQDSRVEFQLPEMSDGTIRLLGLLAMLRQRVPPALVVIEEPENALHAHAVQHFLSVARQVTMQPAFASQLFFTSHSPAVVDGMLNIEAMRETNWQTACFVTQRRPKSPAIVPAPPEVMKAIANNLGRPSDFQREGDFGDEPVQLPLPLDTPKVE